MQGGVASSSSSTAVVVTEASIAVLTLQFEDVRPPQLQPHVRALSVQGEGVECWYKTAQRSGVWGCRGALVLGYRTCL